MFGNLQLRNFSDISFRQFVHRNNRMESVEVAVSEPIAEEPVVEVIEEKDLTPKSENEEVNGAIEEVTEEEKGEEEEEKKEVVEEESEKKEGENQATQEEVEAWKMIGNVCLTPCGHGVLSTRTDDDRAGVLLIASYVFNTCI